MSSCKSQNENSFTRSYEGHDKRKSCPAKLFDQPAISTERVLSDISNSRRSMMNLSSNGTSFKKDSFVVSDSIKKQEVASLKKEVMISSQKENFNESQPSSIKKQQVEQKEYTQYDHININKESQKMTKSMISNISWIIIISIASFSIVQIFKFTLSKIAPEKDLDQQYSFDQKNKYFAEQLGSLLDDSQEIVLSKQVNQNSVVSIINNRSEQQNLLQSTQIENYSPQNHQGEGQETLSQLSLVSPNNEESLKQLSNQETINSNKQQFQQASVQQISNQQRQDLILEQEAEQYYIKLVEMTQVTNKKNRNLYLSIYFIIDRETRKYIISNLKIFCKGTAQLINYQRQRPKYNITSISQSNYFYQIQRLVDESNSITEYLDLISGIKYYISLEKTY